MSLHQNQVNQDLQQSCIKIENASNDLKQAVTNAIKVVEKTKIQIIKILEVQDEMLKKPADEKLVEESKFVSFSQEFNDLIEHKRELKEEVFVDTKEPDSVNTLAIERIRHSRVSQLSSTRFQKQDENEEDDFFDAVGD